MRRIRWYHFFFTLAVFDVVVIFVSLELHRHTLDQVARVVDAANQLNDQFGAIQHVEQQVLELSSTVADAVVSTSPGADRARLQAAASKLDAALRRAAHGTDGFAPVADAATRMTAAANRVLEAVEQAPAANPDPVSRLAALEQSVKARADMEHAQREAVRRLALLAARNAADRNGLLQSYEDELQGRLRNERFFIAFVIVFLVGLLYLGRKLQSADRALEAERRRVLDERRERLAAIGELSSSVAHGIRNPLAAMRSSAQLSLELGRMDDDTRERLNDILTEGLRLSDRVTRLLSFARANADAFEPLALQPLVNAAVAEIQPELSRRGVLVERRFADVPVTVRGDRHQLQQAVIELLSNAMEQSKPGDAIRVACDGGNGRGVARLSVEDHGGGVPPETRNRLFELFFSTKPNGTGIGLATVRRIARLHGGDVTLAGGEPGCTRFELSLPTATICEGRDE